MSFAIGIPTLNRIDLLLPSLLFYKHSFPNTIIYVVDNGGQLSEYNLSFPNLKIISVKQQLNVGASWNVLCKEIFKNHNHALILNDDIDLGKTQSYIQTLIDSKPDKFIRSTNDWCAFILPKIIYEKVGYFDECFTPAYYEDKSYEYRMKLNGVLAYKSPSLIPFVYRSSQTLEKLPSILEASKANKKLYIQMWGGEPESEKFKQAYNGKKSDNIL
jgi:GT2 family glycosyltransferase